MSNQPVRVPDDHTSTITSIETITKELEYLRNELPETIMSSCHVADDQLSQAQNQLRYVIVGGPSGSGKSTLIEAVTGVLELLPSGGTTKSLTMVPTWLRASHVEEVSSDGTSSSEDGSRQFSPSVAHSVHSNSWPLLRRKVLERWQRSLNSCDEDEDEALRVLLENQALDVLKSVYPILSTNPDSSGNAPLTTLFKEFMRLIPGQLEIEGLDDTQRAQTVVNLWLEELRGQMVNNLRTALSILRAFHRLPLLDAICMALTQLVNVVNSHLNV